MINANLLNQAGISYEAGMNRFMNDAELYEAVLTAFIQENILERAEKAYAINDMVRLREVIHEVKGSAGNAGLDILFKESSALMIILRSTSFTEEELAKGYASFVKSYIATKDGIKLALGK